MLPTFSEQVAEQLGGVRGVVESSIPVAVFVIVNIVWALRAGADRRGRDPRLLIAVLRLLPRQSVRHAVNGLFGIAIGARHRLEDRQREGLLPAGHPAQRRCTALAMIGSVLVRRPLVGWIWSLVVDRRQHPLARRPPAAPHSSAG